jgi:hypothetical protein
VGVACIVIVQLWPSGATTAPPSPGKTSAQAQRLAVPAYIDPVTDRAAWTELAGGRGGSVAIVVANVDNGPGSAPVPDWATVIGQTHRAGSTVLGYVDTGYLGSPTGSRSTGLATRTGASGLRAWLSQAESDIDAWYQFYGSDIGGIFLDETTDACGPTTTSTEYADEYRALSAYVKLTHPDALTVLNPGTAVGQCYRGAADVLVTFEGSYADYTSSDPSSDSSYHPLDWTPAAPDQIWHIVYGAASIGELRRAVTLSKSRAAGYVYVTSAGAPNPFDQLPSASYWSEEQRQTSA